MVEFLDSWDVIYPKMQYWTKMQVGKEYYFILFLSGDPQEIEELEILDIKIEEIIVDDLHGIAKEINQSKTVHSSFNIRLSSPALKIEPSKFKFKYYLSEKSDIKKFVFRIIPNHYGEFQVLLEFIKNGIVFFNKIIEITIQKKGIKIKNLQISNSLVSFLSISISIITFIPQFFSLGLPISIIVFSTGLSLALLIFWLYNRVQHNKLIQLTKNSIQKIAFRFDKVSFRFNKVSFGFDKSYDDDIRIILKGRKAPSEEERKKIKQWRESRKNLTDGIYIDSNNEPDNLNQIFIPVDNFQENSNN